jgi:hypothetical protein
MPPAPAAPRLWRWVHPEKRRYYQAVLSTDLFGDWTLTLSWGGLGSARGNWRMTGVASEEEGLRQVAALDARRRGRGYRATGSAYSPINTL